MTELWTTKKTVSFHEENLDIAHTWNILYDITENKKEIHGRKMENNTRLFWLHVSLLVDVCIFC